MKRAISSFIVVRVARRDEDQWDPLDSLGKTGATVAKNIRAIRRTRGLAYTELAAKLKDLQREIPTWGLRKIESGGRRVDTDDLIALAIALDVFPSTLLMPESANATDTVEVTGVDGGIEARRWWHWLVAISPLQTGRQAFFGVLNRAIPEWDDIQIAESGVGTNVTAMIVRAHEQHYDVKRAPTDGDD